MAAFYTFSDFSGASTPVTGDNPYQDLIAACHDDPAQIQSRYNTHRTNRNNQQRTKLLAQDFPGVTIDEILSKLRDPTNHPSYQDWRNCLVFWARPPAKIRAVIAEVQRRLQDVVPGLWTMPQENLHMTAMEVTHSLTAPEIEELVQTLRPAAQEIANFTFEHRARLVKPTVSFDAQALAFSLLPAAGEGGGEVEEDRYTYHHLRRDLFDKIQAAGVKVASRYVVPSAHLTIGRFITTKDFEEDPAKMKQLVSRIEEVNEWLETEFWPREDGNIPPGGQWVVGEEKGLDSHKGLLWYGDGERVVLGRGF